VLASGLNADSGIADGKLPAADVRLTMKGNWRTSMAIWACSVNFYRVCSYRLSSSLFEARRSPSGFWRPEGFEAAIRTASCC